MPDVSDALTAVTVEYPGDVLIGEWLVQPGQNRASRADTTVHLRPQLVDVLMCLAHKPGRTISRRELMSHVWPGQTVAESALPRCVAELRSALGDNAQTPALIETIPKRGYRLIAQVTPADGRTPAAADAQAEAAALTPALPAGPSPAMAIPSSVDLVSQDDLIRQSVVRRLAWPVLVAALFVATMSLGVFVSTRPAAATVNRPSAKDTIAMSFANTTGDPAFDETVPMALAIHIEQPPVFRLTPQHAVRDALLGMKQPVNARITPELALSLCDTLGTRAVLRCSITPVGQQYVVGLEATGCASRQTIARAQQQAPSKEHVLDALSMVAGTVRAQLGASFTGYQHSVTPLPGWTPSWSGTKRVEALNSNR